MFNVHFIARINTWCGLQDVQLVKGSYKPVGHDFVEVLAPLALLPHWYCPYQAGINCNCRKNQNPSFLPLTADCDKAGLWHCSLRSSTVICLMSEIGVFAPLNTAGRPGVVASSASCTMCGFLLFPSPSITLSAGIIVSNSNASSKLFVSSSTIRSRKSSSAVWCLMPAWCTTSKANSKGHGYQCKRFCDASGRFSVHCYTSWSVQILNLALSRMQLARIRPIYSSTFLWVESCARPASLSDFLK